MPPAGRKVTRLTGSGSRPGVTANAAARTRLARMAMPSINANARPRAERHVVIARDLRLVREPAWLEVVGVGPVASMPLNGVDRDDHLGACLDRHAGELGVGVGLP